MRFIWLVLAFLAFTQAQKIFVVQESAPVGTFIGKIDAPGPYFIADHDIDGVHIIFCILQPIVDPR